MFVKTIGFLPLSFFLPCRKRNLLSGS